MDELMMRFVDVLYSLPFILIVILLTVIFGPNLYLLFGALGAIYWLDMARIVRGQTLKLKNASFVLAAEAQGASTRYPVTPHYPQRQKSRDHLWNHNSTRDHTGRKLHQFPGTRYSRTSNEPGCINIRRNTRYGDEPLVASISLCMSNPYDLESQHSGR